MSGKRVRNQLHTADVALAAAGAGDGGGAERDFRRGYCDGWMAAINTLFDLYDDRTREFEAAYDETFHHHDKTLTDWMQGNCSRRVPPPQLLALLKARSASEPDSEEPAGRDGRERP